MGISVFAVGVEVALVIQRPRLLIEDRRGLLCETAVLERVSGLSTLLSTSVEIYDTWIQPPSVFGLCCSLLKPQYLLHINCCHAIIPILCTLADLLQFARGRQPSMRNPALDAQLNMNLILRRMHRDV